MSGAVHSAVLAPAAIGFLKSRALGPQSFGDLFVGFSVPEPLGGPLFHFNLTGNRRKIGVGDPRPEDRVADNLTFHDMTESESLLIGRDFGILTYIKTGPNGNLFVISLDQGTIYDPSRKTLRSAPDYIKENLNVAGQYVEGFFTGGEVDSLEEIKAGEGGIVRRGLTKVAVYRDDSGTLHELSAVCRHLGCIVAWNPDEKTWDCPCHGSRYDRYGRVITGPANSDLEPAQE